MWSTGRTPAHAPRQAEQGQPVCQTLERVQMRIKDTGPTGHRFPALFMIWSCCHNEPVALQPGCGYSQALNGSPPHHRRQLSLQPPPHKALPVVPPPRQEAAGWGSLWQQLVFDTVWSWQVTTSSTAPSWPGLRQQGGSLWNMMQL